MKQHSLPFRKIGIDCDGDCYGTAGPWKFDSRSMTVQAIAPRTGMRPAGDPYPVVCRMPRSYTPQEVDGHLIAAAPGLLAACESICKDLEDRLLDCDSPGSRQTLETQIQTLRHAIRTAYGE